MCLFCMRRRVPGKDDEVVLLLTLAWSGGQAAKNSSTRGAPRQAPQCDYQVRLRRLGPKVLYAPGVCVAHKIHLIVSSNTKETDLVGNLHALEFVYRVQGRRSQVWTALKSIIHDELVLLAGPPTAALVRQNRSMSEHCILRFEEQIRSGIFGGAVLTDGGGEALLAGMECLLNVDRVGVTHICPTFSPGSPSPN